MARNCRKLPTYYAASFLPHYKGQKISKKNMLSWILPKNERWGNFMCWKLPQRSFFGRIQDAIICFWDLLTFSGLKIIAISRPSASNFKSLSQSLEQFLLTVGQNNFDNKILFLLGCKKLYYCGKNCFKKAWKSYHSKECGFLKDTSLEDLEELDFERMVVRTILR
jgi:hypothetical protein